MDVIMGFKLDGVVRMFFLIMYIISGSYLVLLVDGAILPFFKNIIIYSYLMFSAVVGCIGLIAYIFRKKTNVYLWICSVYWVVVCGAELLENNNVLPNKILVIVMLVVSIACISYLIFDKITKQGGSRLESQIYRRD